jgi:hypothetical protein
LQKKLRSGLGKGNEKKSRWDGTWIEKRILSVHHPSTLVHWWVLVHSGPNLDAMDNCDLHLDQCFGWFFFIKRWDFGGIFFK